MKRVIGFLLYCSGCALALGAQTNAADIAELKAYAASQVLEEYADVTGEVSIFLYENILDQEILQSLQDYQNPEVDVPFEYAAVVFVDLMPGANWGHPCRYFFFDQVTQHEYVYDTYFPLALPEYIASQRLNPVTEIEQLVDSADAILKESITGLLAAPPKVAPDESKYAVLISGGARRESNNERYYNNLQLMYLTLVKNYGYPEGQIRVFFAGGALNENGAYDDANANTHVDGGGFVEVYNGHDYELKSSDFDGDGDCDVSGAATIATVEGVLSGELANELTPVSASRDLLVYTYDHGGRSSGRDAYLCMWRENWDDDELVGVLSDAPYSDLRAFDIVMLQCFSGGFIDDLESSDLPLFTFTSACDYYESSYDISVAGGEGSFTFNWPIAASGEHWSDVDVDPQNAQLSIRELYSYSRQHDTFWPQNDPDGAPEQESGTEHPQLISTPDDLSGTAHLGDFTAFACRAEGTIRYETPSSGLLPLQNVQARLYHRVLGLFDWECGNGVNYTQSDGGYQLSTNLIGNVFLKARLANDFVTVLDDDWNPLWADVFQFQSSTFTTQPGWVSFDMTIDQSTGGMSACNPFGVMSDAQLWFFATFDWARFTEDPATHTPTPDQISVIWIGSNARDVQLGYNSDEDYIGVNDEHLWDNTFLTYNYGLANIYNAYGYEWPQTNFSANTGLNVVSDEGMALRNGLAWFLTAAIADDPTAVEFNGENLETNTWWQGEDGSNTNGRAVEGAVASFLWDLFDSNNEGGDNIGGYLYEIWYLITQYQPQTITEFIGLWPYGDITSVANHNHLLPDHHVVVLEPTDGLPLIVDYLRLDPVAMDVTVHTTAGVFVSGLSADKFSIYINDQAAPIETFVESGTSYLIEIDPPDIGVRGLFDVEVTIHENTSEESSDFVLGGALYTSNATIERGLAWLKANQSVTTTQTAYIDEYGTSIDAERAEPDQSVAVAEYGSWRYGSSPNAGITALALQAFLAAGYGIDHPTYGLTVERGLNYLIHNQRADGSIYNSSQGYETAMSIVALSSALKTELPEPLHTQVQSALNLAVNYLTYNVNAGWSRVSWRYNSSYTSQDGGDMSVSQWVYLALEAADYTDKDVWNKIYSYINYWKRGSGTENYIGYYQGSSRERGNTLAAIWGLSLAAQHGVTGVDALSQRMFNYIDNMCPFNTLVSHPNLTTYCVYSGAGYYYYIYELAKAMALGGKTQFCEENWYDVLSSRIDGQHFEDANGYYWRTGFTDNTGYYVASGGMGNHGQTALALLSLQVGTVPPGTSVRIRLNAGNTPVEKADGYDGLYMEVSDGGGNVAYPAPGGTWITTIPNSRWLTTGDVQELEVDLAASANFSICLHNESDSSSTYELTVEGWQAGLAAPTDAASDAGSIAAASILCASATVNAINVLTVFLSPFVLQPQMAITPDSLFFTPIENGAVYDFSFTIAEVGDSVPLTNIDIFANDLVDSAGHVIPASAFSFVPSHIDSIPAGGSVAVNAHLTIPPETMLDLTEAGLFAGGVTIESARQSRRIDIRASTCRGGSILFPLQLSTAMVNQIGSYTFYDSVVYHDTITIDPFQAPIYVGYFDEKHPAASVDTNTVRINSSIEPESVVLIPTDDPYAVPIFNGACLRVNYNLAELVQYYIDLDPSGQLWDTHIVTYTITGQFTDGMPFAVCGEVPLVGHRSGDVDQSGGVNVADLSYLVTFLFSGGPPPEPLSAGDVNHDGALNISDLTELTRLLFL